MSQPSEQQNKQKSGESADITVLLLDVLHTGVWDVTIDILMRTKVDAAKETHA